MRNPWDEYSVRYSLEEELKVATLAPTEDQADWWAGVGRVGFAIAIAAAASTAVMTQVAAAILENVDEPMPRIGLGIDDEPVLRRFVYVNGNSVVTYLGEAQSAVFTIKADDEPDINQPTVLVEPTVYIIGPGNWAAGTDEIPRPTKEEEYWENPVAPQWWDIRQEKPWYLPDDPTSPRQPSDDSEQLPEIGPFADPLVFIIGPGNWAAGSDETPTFFGLSRDEDYWIDPNTITTPLGEIIPTRTYAFQQDDPRLLGRIVDEELWRNPKELLDYWNRWPRPDFQQDDPSGLFVPPNLVCVVEPVIGGIVGIGATFSTVTGLVVPFTDTCGNPL